jgi:transcriptional regulator with XRE-family HTH domain
MSKPPGRARVRRAFSRTLRELRHRIGLSQESLAHEAEIGRGYMSALERGVNNPTLELLTRLVRPLKVSLTEFVTEFERNLSAH